MKRAALLLVVPLLLAAGCSGNSTKDDLQVANTATAATPATVPLHTPPAGARIAVSGAVLDTVLSGDTLAVVQRDKLLLYPVNQLGAAPRAVTLPGVPGSVSATDGGWLVPIPQRHQVLTVTTAGSSTSVTVNGNPSAAVRYQGQLLVAVPDRNGIAVLRGDPAKPGREQRLITGDIAPQQLYVVNGHVVAIDTVRTAAYDVNVSSGNFGAGLRLGNGAARATADGYGRLLVTDARSGSLLALSVGPVLIRQLAPVGPAPFGIAYDPTRKLIWVTLTGRNEVAGYAIGQGEPVQRYRFPTVSQPDSVAVDPRSGAVIVGSAATDGLAVLHP